MNKGHKSHDGVLNENDHTGGEERNLMIKAANPG